MPQMDDTSRSGIYQIRCLANGKIYVGSAAMFKERWRYHRRDLGAGKHHSRHLQRAWDQYGENSFVFEVLEFIDDPDKLVAAEQDYLDRLRPFDHKMGFNISPTAWSQLGVKRSDETRAKLSVAKRLFFSIPENRARFGEFRRGSTLTDEHKAAIAEAGRNRVLSPESLAKMSASQKGRVVTPEHRAKLAAANLGKKHKPESIAKMSIASTGRRHTEESKAKIAAAHRGKPISDEVKAILSEIATKQWSDPDARARMSKIKKAGPKPTPEHMAKLQAGWKAARERKLAAQSMNQPTFKFSEEEVA